MNACQKVLSLLYIRPMTAEELVWKTGFTRHTVHCAVCSIRKAGYTVNKFERKYSIGKHEPHRTIEPRHSHNGHSCSDYRATPGGYSIEELQEIWSRLKEDRTAFKKLAQFALCSEETARRLVDSWSH